MKRHEIERSYTRNKGRQPILTIGNIHLNLTKDILLAKLYKGASIIIKVQTKIKPKQDEMSKINVELTK